MISLQPGFSNSKLETQDSSTIGHKQKITLQITWVKKTTQNLASSKDKSTIIAFCCKLGNMKKIGTWFLHLNLFYLHALIFEIDKYSFCQWEDLLSLFILKNLFFAAMVYPKMKMPCNGRNVILIVTPKY